MPIADARRDLRDHGIEDAKTVVGLYRALEIVDTDSPG
jgi:hypothetical protein